MISQSSTIAFFLIIGFIVYITMKGELPAYAKVVGLGKSTVKDSSITAADMENAQ